MQNDVHFQFENFDPDQETKRLASLLAEKLHLISPSDAVVKMVFRKGSDAIKASCRIASRAGIFVADAASDSPVQAAQLIERKIKIQLDQWKACRFQYIHYQEAI